MSDDAEGKKTTQEFEHRHKPPRCEGGHHDPSCPPDPMISCEGSVPPMPPYLCKHWIGHRSTWTGASSVDEEVPAGEPKSGHLSGDGVQRSGPAGLPGPLSPPGSQKRIAMPTLTTGHSS